ncbi:hypothetical protein [Hyphomicrobium sulfonivorans]|uniref:hypothetical protein n=1 Tax=Hyphomicrobium sulfonivorans TaxID=121290 RepID=UPI0015715C59|nr:hypothetical protein [Hyphomicrobium sulfonivorans]MBI1651221.1 hypothetical protein [Hyphomicrobium sulfonivorans]NSL73171.1 hypothetical protein [Hyphomicrobium sulfonivorans]
MVLRGVWAAVLLALLCGGVHAMMAPEYYRSARQEAPFHVQVAIEKMTPPETALGRCLVAGKVIETFKDETGRLPLGTALSFGVACYRANAKVPVGAAIWTPLEALMIAGFIEVYLVERDDGFDVALWNTRIIDAPSAKPQFSAD